MLLPETSIPTNRYGLIYVVTHRDSGKQYVGQTVKFADKRWEGHINKSKRKLRHVSYIAAAINKHGQEAFDMEIVDWAMSKETLDHKECFWIAFLDTMDSSIGYNLKDGGAAGHLSPEVCARIAKTLTGRKLPVGHPFTIKGRRAPMKGKTRKPEWNANHGQLLRAKFAAGEIKNPSHPPRPVICVETGQQFYCLKEAERWLQTANLKARGLSDQSISRATRKPSCMAGGYHWQLVQSSTTQEDN